MLMKKIVYVFSEKNIILRSGDMYILVTNGKSYVTFPWLREIACRNYKGETKVFTTKELYNFLY